MVRKSLRQGQCSWLKAIAVAFAFSTVAKCALAAEYVIDVPEGEVVSNTTSNVSAESDDVVLVKTGGGTYYTTKELGYSTSFARLEVREGTLFCDGSGCRINTTDGMIAISNGATLVATEYILSRKPAKIHVADGGVLDCNNKTFLTLADTKLTKISGDGTIKNSPRTDGSASRPAQILSDFRGTISWETNATVQSFYYCNFGDGENPEYDVNWSQMKGVRFFSPSYDRIRFRPKNAAAFTINSLIGVGGQIEALYGDMDIESPRISNFMLTFAKTCTLHNGQIGFDSAPSSRTDIQYASGSAGAKLVLDGGYYAAVSVGTSGDWPWKDAATVRKVPSGIMIKSTGTETSLVLTNGATARIGNSAPKYVTISDGCRLEMTKASLGCPSDASTSSRQVMKIDGGEWRVMSDFNSGGNRFGSGSKQRLVVGARGGLVSAFGRCQVHGFTFPASLIVDSEEGTSGTLAFSGRHTITFNEPLALNGPLELRSASYYFANTDNLKASTSVNGSGDLVLGLADVNSSFPAGSPLRLARGDGAQLILNGNATIVASTTTGNRWEFGPADAEACPISAARGASLWIQAKGTTTAYALDGSSIKVAVNGGVPLKAGKFSAIPIFYNDKRANLWGTYIYLTTYSAENGVTEFRDYVTGLGGGASSVAMVGYGTECTADATVLGLNVTMASFSGVAGYPADAPGSSSENTGDLSSSKSTLTIAEGATLTVGDGTGYAPVLLNSSGNTSLSTIKGAGTLDFGAADAMFAVNTYGGAVLCRIAGTGGITFCGTANNTGNGGDDAYERRGSILIGGAQANTYSGGTRITGTTVHPLVGTAFGVGDVFVKGDVCANSPAIRIDAGLDLRFTNAFHVAGYGSVGAGAVRALGRVEFAGGFEMTGPTRICLPRAEAEVEFSGTLRGDLLSLWNPSTNTFDEVGNVVKAWLSCGRTVISGMAGSTTGAIEVVRSTLELKDGAQPAGGIELDDGLLEIDANSPVEMASVVTGCGTVRLTGQAQNELVKFRRPNSLDQFVQQDHVLDLGGRKRAVNTLQGFTSVTSSTPQAVVLSVLDDEEGSFTGEVSENVTLCFGKIAPPSGIIILFR